MRHRRASTGMPSLNGWLEMLAVQDAMTDSMNCSELVHPWVDSCVWTEVLRWKDVFFWISPVYAALHFIPPILFKRKQFVKRYVAVYAFSMCFY